MYDKIFKNCNVIYIKDMYNFKEIVGFLKGKTIISDFKELISTCNKNGIIHILHTKHSIPNEKIDCIIANKTDQIETELIRSELNIPVIYLEQNKKWCGTCHTLGALSGFVNKYCSEKCMQSYNGFMQNFKPEAAKDLNFNSIINKQREKQVVIEFEKSTSEVRNSSSSLVKTDKFQKGMEKEADRLHFACKRETYKNQMKKQSLRKELSNKATKDTVGNSGDNICKGLTKKGERCVNKALGASNFCGIASHSMN